MFTNLIYLITVLLLVSMAPGSEGYVSSPWAAFSLGMGGYGALLGLILLQNRWSTTVLRRRPSLMLGLVNLELICFFGFFHFFLAAHRVFPESVMIPPLFTLALYFGALWLYYHSCFSRLSFMTRNQFETAEAYVGMQLRMLIPFTIPFLIFSGLMDIGSYYQPDPMVIGNGDPFWELILTLLGSLLFLTLVMIFFPAVIQHIWKCEPIKDVELRERLENLCKRAGFKHAGMHTWTIMNHALTAGIIGIVPQFRYVMFTKRLLNELSPEAVEAILAHEIAHSQRKHLIIYPFILFGMIIASAFFSLFFAESIEEYFALKNLLYPSEAWGILLSVALFVPFALILALYFRLVFGYFSRLFERQADLNVFELDIPHTYLLEGLDYIATATGNTHKQPSWHHFSIQQRIDYLNEAALEPEKRKKHHKRVKRNVIGYFFLLFFAVWLLFFPPEKIRNGVEVISHGTSEWVTGSLREELAKRVIEEHRLEGNQEVIMEALTRSYTPYASTQLPGIAEYIAAELLYEAGEYSASRKLASIAEGKLEDPTQLPELQTLIDKLGKA